MKISNSRKQQAKFAQYQSTMTSTLMMSRRTSHHNRANHKVPHRSTRSMKARAKAISTGHLAMSRRQSALDADALDIGTVSASIRDRWMDRVKSEQLTAQR
eukprot:7146134-Karenia_brevis.AAC.1